MTTVSRNLSKIVSENLSPKVQSRELISKRLIGKGYSSIVYETTWKGESYARKDFLRVPSDIFETEAAVLVSLESHPNVVRTYCWTVDEESCSLVIELMGDDLLNVMQRRKASQRKKLNQDSGPSDASQMTSHLIDLHKFIEDRRKAPVATSSESGASPLIYPFDVTEALQVIVQISEGMTFLHEREVVHGDLKPKNILVSLSGRWGLGSHDQKVAFEVKVSDFGLRLTKMKSRTLGSRQARNLEMVRWRAPELWDLSSLNEQIRPNEHESSTDSDWDSDLSDGKTSVHFVEVPTYYSDVYSFALICSQILTGEDPYSGLGLHDLVRKVPGGLRPKLPDTCPAQLRHLIESCWGEKDKRPSFFSILNDLKALQASLALTDYLEDIKKKAIAGAPLERKESLQEAQSSEIHDHAVDKGYQPETKAREITFDYGVRPLRILVLGDSKSVEACISDICGAVKHTRPVQDHVSLTESSSAWTLQKGMCLYAATKWDGYSFTDIKTFLKARNRRWHQDTVQASWKAELNHRSVHGELLPLFPGMFAGKLRLHMVWYVCGTKSDRPTGSTWSKITKKLYGLPVWILMAQDVPHGYHFSSGHFLDDCFMEVSKTDNNWKENLWRECWAVTTRAEIGNAAMIISRIQKKLRPVLYPGVPILGGNSVGTSKESLLSRSGEFVLMFLCAYWDFPQDLIHGVLRNSTNFEPEANKISIYPRGFVKFCLQVAAIILDNASNPRRAYNWLPAVSNAQLLLKEAKVCYDSYFPNTIKPSAYDEMTCGDIRAFLQRIADRQGRHETPSKKTHRRTLGHLFRKVLKSYAKFQNGQQQMRLR